jgi:hypothetical protein
MQAEHPTGHSVRPIRKEYRMNSLIYFVGLIVVVLAILSFVGLR